MFPQLDILMNTWFEERIWNLKKKKKKNCSRAKRVQKTELHSVAVGVMPVKWRCAVQNRHQTPKPISSLQRTSREEKLTIWVWICVCWQGRIRRLKKLFCWRTPCRLSSAWHSKRSLFSLPPPRHSPSLEQDRRHVQIPEHSSIKTFWLLTRPQKMVDMCLLQGARQGFSHVTLSLSLKWNITHRNCAGWCSVRLTDFMCVY